MSETSLRKRRRKRMDSVVRLNITSMIDMFTLMVVFLLKNYSAQGQLVTPAQDLRLPVSTVEKTAGEALTVKVSQNNIMVENTIVVEGKAFLELTKQKDFKIGPLYEVLVQNAKGAQKSAEMFRTEFSGRISIQGDVEIPYAILTKIMYTCGQAGYPIMNLVVYRRE